uniref:ATP synthase F0 subunit 8 n=1 Tax=Poecilochirus mrciaki TaxID=3127720 RepID=UPI0030E1BFA7
MPQMAPMNWLFISPMTIIICVTCITIIYFSFNLTPSNKSSSEAITKINPSFKW